MRTASNSALMCRPRNLAKAPTSTTGAGAAAHETAYLDRFPAMKGARAVNTILSLCNPPAFMRWRATADFLQSQKGRISCLWRADGRV